MSAEEAVDKEKAFQESMKKLESHELQVEDQVAILAYVNYLFISRPQKDETTFELIRPYVNACIIKSNNWLVFSKALMYRSRNEADRTKTAEKCMKQLQALIDQFRDQDVTTLEKIDYAFCTQYPMSWGIKKELADLYQRIGIFMSAHELLETVGLHDESIKCLFMAGR